MIGLMNESKPINPVESNLNVDAAQSPIERARPLGLLVVIAATIGLALIGLSRADLPTPAFTSSLYVNQHLTYQLVTLGLTAVVLLILFALGPRVFRRYFHVGRLDAPVEPVRALGINTNGRETWRQVGRNFAVIITAVTAIFIYLTLVRGQAITPIPWGYLLFVPLLAAVNAFVEEMITRFGVVVALDGIVARPVIYLTSAAIFGIVHYFGTPGGLPGVALAGFLGWLLAKSIVETRGVFWAWFIHFLQDVVIIGGMFLVNL